MNLLNNLEKEINARLAEHFITFCSEFKKLNNTGAGMLDSIYHMSPQKYGTRQGSNSRSLDLLSDSLLTGLQVSV